MATLNKRGKSYVLNWSEGGKQYRRSLGPISRADAEDILAIKITELQTGQRLTPYESETVLFREFVPDYLHWHKYEYPSSHVRIRQIIHDHLLPEFGHRDMETLPPRDVERWKAFRLLSAKPGTVAKELRTLKAVLNKAVAWEAIKSHRIGPVAAPKRINDSPPPYYTTEELTALYAASIAHSASWRFLANTGLRRAEFMQARRKDIVSNQLRVLSTNKARTKSARWRLVPLSPGAIEALEDLGDDYIAPRIRPQSVSRAFKIDAEAAGIGGSLKWLRHTFCSHLVMSGVDLRTVQELAGHASFTTTLIYAHLGADHLSSAVSKINL